MESWLKKRKAENEINVVTKHHKLEVKKMFGWGSTIHGELGLGGIEDENIFTPRKINFDKATEITQISCGQNYSIAVTKDGEVYSCGNNDYGQLGQERGRKKLQPIEGIDPLAFRKAACGANHTLVINEWGQLFSWGCNMEGQLGIDSTDATERVPRIVKALGTKVVVQIACGLKHSIALTNNGELYAWGSNSDGQLGLGKDTKLELKPRLVQSLASVPIAFVACGGYHTIVISKSGTIFSWGRNTFGQLGLNDIQDRHIPSQLFTLNNSRICYAACGEEFSAFLTMEGGVFTCGAGMYGQLGHGNKANEILPRQVMELMGSTVTQIACGRRHTLALVPSRGRVYAWGLGGAGQLGNKHSQNVATPQIVLGPWVSPGNSTVIKIDLQYSPYTTDYVIKRIFSGGDHCFATVTPRKDNVEPDDCRILGPTSQILTVIEEQLAACREVSAESSVEHELITYLETVFRSQACINASFLLANEAHYGCSSKHHGINFDQAIKSFAIISEMENSTIQELIYTCITDSLLPSLAPYPIDHESLRLYLILPLYHGFMNPLHHNNLHKPFCKALLGLTAEDRHVLSVWWSMSPPHYFERLVRMYKAVVLHFAKQTTADKTVVWNVTLNYALTLLRLLYKVNCTQENMIVPYETFHLPALMSFINIRADYLKWLMEDPTSQFHKIYFCNFPFLLDAEAKTILLETDQAVQMRTAMNEAASRAIRHILFYSMNPCSIDARQHNQFLILNVSREAIVTSTLSQLSQYDSSDLKKPLRVKFHGEEAEDAGGVKKEFFMLLLREILDPKFGMFKQYEETRTIWFSEDSFEDEVMYFLIGILCGLAIYNFIIIDLPFPLALYKKLLRETVGLNDIKDMSPVIVKSMQCILDYNESDFEEVFNLTFEVNREAYGEQKTYQLIPGGSKIPVTLKNKKQFVDLYVDYILNKSVESHFKAFNAGFHKVCGGRVLELFHSYELMSVVVGNENYDWEQLEENTTYKEGYSRTDPTIVLFWQVFHELSLEQKKKFLLFLTGSDRIPIQGMKAIRITIQPMSDERFLPVAHTCFNLLDLPRYQTRERLKYKLLQAIQQNEGFSLV